MLIRVGAGQEAKLNMVMENMTHIQTHREKHTNCSLGLFLKAYACFINAITVRVVIRNIFFLALLGTTIETVMLKGASLASTEVGKTVVAATRLNRTIADFDSVVRVKTSLDESDAVVSNSASQLWASTFDAHDTHAILQGNWQSCLQDDGAYGERAYDIKIRGRYIAVLHLGPRDEFALYRPATDPSGEHSHETEDNLLGPAFRVSDVETWRGKRQWAVRSLHLWISIVRAGGSRDDCDSFYIRIEEK